MKSFTSSTVAARWMGWSMFALAGLIVTPALACNIPVFRYALERWQSDVLDVTLYHDGELSAEQKRQVDQLRSSGAGQGGVANFRLHIVDVSKSVEALNSNVGPSGITSTVGSSTSPRPLVAGARSAAQFEWQQLRERLAIQDSTLPYVVAKGNHIQGEFVAWHGPLAAASDFNDSPARRKLAKRLLAGDAIVWLVIQSSDPAESSELQQRLKTQLKELERTVEMPEGIGLPGSELFAEVPLLMQFSMVEVQRNDANESFLLGLAEGFQPDAFEDGEPLVVPVFGRGRALEVIPARRLSDNLIRDLTHFLCAACSCQVKEQNPGFDLLVQTDWEQELFGEEGEKPPESPEGLGQRKQAVLLEVPKGRVGR